MSDGWKSLSREELQKRIDDEKIIERDWKLLTKAKGFEKTHIKRAISIYEGFVSNLARYPLPYLRLPIIYRKQKNYVDEIRVLSTAVIVFERDHDDRNLADAKSRLEKAKSLLERDVH